MAQQMHGDTADVEISIGKIRGRRQAGLYLFSGVPYAQAPAGARRFLPAMPKQAWQGVFDATQPSAVAPQLTSRLVKIMGDFERGQSEDCLHLEIVSPGLDARRRPVVVWFHGGGFSSGSGALDWYDGSTLAREGDVVTVGVNYRLGALGYLLAPGVSEGNLGLLDQALALRFVRDNISSFGGDPEDITLMGQSAGASSILALFAGGHATDGVRRAILQSAPLGMHPQTQEQAQRIGSDFLDAIGVDAGSSDARNQACSVSLEAILAAQAGVARAHARLGDTAPPFQLVSGSAALPEPGLVANAAAGAMQGIDLIVGVTADEAEAFFALDPRIQALESAELPQLVASLHGQQGTAMLDRANSDGPGMSAAALLSKIVSHAVFVSPSLDFANQVAAAGGRVFFYGFDWRSAFSGLGSCHCLELPFVFGPTAAWSNAPMMRMADDVVADLSVAIRTAWLSFINTGTPRGEGLPTWPPFADGERAVMHLDEKCFVRDAGENGL